MSVFFFPALLPLNRHNTSPAPNQKLYDPLKQFFYPKILVDAYLV